MLRVFTRGTEGGNPLGVVTDLTGLVDTEMQQVASDLGFSETVFVDWADPRRPKARIFTPGTELPFAGHPLVGLGWLLDSQLPKNPGILSCGIGEIRYRMKDGMSLISVSGGQRVRDLGDKRRLVVQMPLEYELVRLDSAEDVRKAEPPTDEVHRYMWAWENEKSSVKARFFASALGVTEDPATGSAAVALARALQYEGMEMGEIEIHQGDEIGAPSTIHLGWWGDLIEIGGTVVLDEVRNLDV